MCMENFHKEFQSKIEDHLLLFDIHKENPFNAHLIVIRSFILAFYHYRNDQKVKEVKDLQQHFIEEFINMYKEELSEDNILSIHHLQKIFHHFFNEQK